jgi:hypothetical protein
MVPYNPLSIDEKGIKMIANEVYSTMVTPAKKVLKQKEHLKAIKDGQVEKPSKAVTSDKPKSTFKDYFAETEEAVAGG